MKITSVNQGSTISFKSGYPTFSSSGHLRANNKPLFKGAPPLRHANSDGKECPPSGCQPIKPGIKVPPEGGILIYRHVDMLGNVLDIKG